MSMFMYINILYTYMGAINFHATLGVVFNWIYGTTYDLITFIYWVVYVAGHGLHFLCEQDRLRGDYCQIQP